MGKVMRYGDVSVDEDRQAMMEAESGILPNVALLKGRLLFDGGYYLEAEKILMDPNIMLSTKRDSVEYNYRLGRVSHSSGKPETALTYYQRCIDQGQDLPNYFAANAALHTGLIYEELGDDEKAMEYYRLCLSMDFDEYRASILQKAKAGTNRVKRK
jgi:tetratricopeptide (TPR) repeat protein